MTYHVNHNVYLFHNFSEEFDEIIRDEYSPEVVIFDPVCDVDKIDMIQDQVLN